MATPPAPTVPAAPVRTPPPPRAAPAAPAPAAKVAAPRLGRLSGRLLPPKMIFNAVEGWGKTSLVAHAPDAAIIMAPRETGYATLLGAGRAPSVDASLVETWPALLALMDDLIARESLPYKVLGFDAMGGFERLCHEFVCQRDFGGDWGEKGFASFQRGYDVSITDWQMFLARLERIHARGCAIVILSHCQVKSFKNPSGPDFDRYSSDVHAKTWAATAKWADTVLFGTFVTVTNKQNGKHKGVGGTDRVIYTERRDAFDAKNRYGMPEALDIRVDHTALWSTLAPYFTNPNTNA